jgi:hypothetical protein
MLQLFNLSVAKVDLNVGWSSKEERARAGTMVALAICWRQCSTGGHAGICAGDAALDWVLIALLLIIGLLAYAIAVAREPSRRGNAGAAGGLSYYEGAEDTRGTGRGAAGAERKLRPDAGLRPDVRALALPIEKRGF